MSMYKQFKTDESMESKGIVIDYGDFRVTVARAGGANKAFARRLEAETKPYRRAINAGTIDPEKADEIVQRVYAETVVRNWETKVDGKWKQGIEAEDGTVLPFKPEHVVATFQKLPDLFDDLKEQSQKVALFREEVREEDSGN